jgi:multisubunit Na+/H+ antiporter MnhB subunit
MKDRWLPIAVLAGVLFAVNAIARFIVWLAASDSDSTQVVIGAVLFGVVGVVMIWAAVRWGRRYPMSRVAPDLAVIILASCLLSVVIGPLAGGSYPFREGASLFFGEVWRYVIYATGGAVLGLLVLTMLGRDYRSQALKHYAERKQAKPVRVVRR